ncbi:hypothetical protein ACIO52_03170 [Nocardia sp. NPDC087230]|uniref:hypothetical protein n=1 Tax=Nocardia sp. NPDC087230 TaxID=3364331 RepID=UPI003811CBDE
MTALLAVCLVSAAAVTTVGASDARAADRAGREARDFAVETVSQILSYDHRNVEQHFTSVLDSLGGEFRPQFEEVSRQVIVPSAQKRQVVTNADVVGSSVIDARPDRAELLLFVNQSTTSAEQPETKIDGSRVRVTVERIGSRWLIVDMKPI